MPCPGSTCAIPGRLIYACGGAPSPPPGGFPQTSGPLITRRSGPICAHHTTTPDAERRSTLLSGTIECRRAGLHDPANSARDLRIAVAAAAALALPVVDTPAVLEVAEFAIGLYVIAQRRSAGGNRLAENSTQRACQFAGPLALHRLGQSLGRYAGAKQGLRGINIADTGDDTLVDECRLDGCAFAGKCGSESPAVEIRPQRLWPKARQQFMTG